MNYQERSESMFISESVEYFVRIAYSQTYPGTFTASESAKVMELNVEAQPLISESIKTIDSYVPPALPCTICLRRTSKELSPNAVSLKEKVMPFVDADVIKSIAKPL